MTAAYTSPSPVTAAVATERFARYEADVGAWVHRIDPEIDDPDGDLAGWPIGIKDLLDVRELPTTSGALSGHGPVASRDATCVALLRKAGAMIFGKTVAVEYGWFGHVTTRNPWDLSRSPGGSSSGSAAAVAAGMCRLALGTQTAGSILRPAAFTGVVGLKFSHGVVPVDGLVPVSTTLDSVGLFGRSATDVSIGAAQLGQLPIGTTVPRQRPTLAWITEYFEECTDWAVRSTLKTALARIDRGRLNIVEFAPPIEWARLAAAHRTVMLREMAASRSEQLGTSPGHFSPKLAQAIREGLAIDPDDYVDALATRDRALRSLAPSSYGFDGWLTPAACSTAPVSGEPGDPACNVPFTLVGFPALALPVALAPDGLPVGLQVVADYRHDVDLLRIGQILETALPHDMRAPIVGQ